jgi:hypothetical protein
MSNSVLNKVRRFPLVIFLKKIFPILAILLIFVITLLIGVWDIKEFKYSDSEFVNISKEQIDSYVESFLGNNIFLIDPSDIENEIKKGNGYISKVYAKKILPNKIGISFTEYEVRYTGYSSDVCHFFSKEGIRLEELCKECESECMEYATSIESVYISSESVLESGNLLIYREEFEKISKLLSQFGYDINDINIVKGISTITDTKDHTFIFDISNDLDIQLSRMYLVGEKINEQEINFKSLDLRFERPVMKLK